ITTAEDGASHLRCSTSIRRRHHSRETGRRHWRLVLPAAEGEVGDAAGAVYGLDLEAIFERLQTVPEPFAAAQHDRHHDDVQVVDQAGGQELADGGRAAADADIPARGG